MRRPQKFGSSLTFYLKFSILKKVGNLLGVFSDNSNIKSKRLLIVGGTPCFFQFRIVREENVCLFFNVPKGPPIDLWFFFQFYKSFLFLLIYTIKGWYFKVISSDFITMLQQQNFEIISLNNKKAKK